MKLNNIKWASAHRCYNLTIPKINWDTIYLNQLVQYTKWGSGSKDTLPWWRNNLKTTILESYFINLLPLKLSFGAVLSPTTGFSTVFKIHLGN